MHKLIVKHKHKDTHHELTHIKKKGEEPGTHSPTPKKKKLKKKKLKISSKETVGWQEWCSLPKLHLPAIKAKIDTGAKTSALHAWDIHPFHRHGELYVHFTIHPLQRDIRITRICTARVIDQRTVMNSGGDKEYRYVIITSITLGQRTWDIEIGLTNRDAMAFRMLLGRDALQGHLIVDPGRKMCMGKLKRGDASRLYLPKSH